jgi:hypothetical protein
MKFSKKEPDIRITEPKGFDKVLLNPTRNKEEK